MHEEKEKDDIEKMYDMYTKKKNKVFKRDEKKEIVDVKEKDMVINQSKAPRGGVKIK